MDGRFVPNITIVSGEAPRAVARLLCCMGGAGRQIRRTCAPLVQHHAAFRTSCAQATLLSDEPATLSTKAAAVYVSQAPLGAPAVHLRASSLVVPRTP